MSEKIINDLVEIIRKHATQDPEVLADQNIKLGLRNRDGTGVIVGATNIGRVTGVRKTLFRDLNQVDAESIYLKLNGRLPEDGEIEVFKSKLTELLPGKVEYLEGVLLYCGIDVKDLVKGHAQNNTYGYEETVYLLLTGELPNQSELGRFSEYMQSRRKLSRDFINTLIGKFTTQHMMNSLQLATQSLYEEFSKEGGNPDATDIESVTRQSIDIIAKFPALAAYLYQAMQHKYREADLKICNSTSDFPHSKHFLHLIKAGESYTDEQARILDVFMMLHAEHGGGNNSTFAVRAVSSSKTDTYSAINTGLASLKGHLHGGANEKVMSMMDDIKSNVRDWKDADEVRNYLTKIMRGETCDGSGKLYGIGHAVYTLSDPRAIIFREIGKELAEKTGNQEEFDLIDAAGEIAPQVVMKLKGGKPVSPNVDFYSGFVLKCIGIPQELFTPIFAASRVAGWGAHRLEQLLQDKLIRPAYFNTVVERPYAPIEERK